MKVSNIHERVVRTSPERARAVFESLGTPQDKLWPRRAWPALRLDAPKEQHGRGGHGPIRYRVSEYIPGVRTTFIFENAGFSRGIDGLHFFELERRGADEFVARHVIEALLGWPAIFFWPVFIRPMHDALVEDALDNFERETTEGLKRPYRYSLYVRLLRAALGRSRK